MFILINFITRTKIEPKKAGDVTLCDFISKPFGALSTALSCQWHCDSNYWVGQKTFYQAYPLQLRDLKTPDSLFFFC